MGEMLTRLQKATTGSFYLLFFVVPLIFFPKTSEVFEFNKIVLTYGITVVIIGLWLMRMIKEQRLVFRRTILDIPLLIFLAAQLLSTLTSIDLRTSFLGYYSRFHGGFLSLFVYSLLYWAYVSNMNRQSTIKSIYILLSSAFLVSIYAVLQHFGIDKDIWVQDVQSRVFSSFGQPNWLAAWLVALLPITWALALNSNFQFKSAKPWLWIGLSAMFFLVLLYTGSRSGLIGFAVANIIFWAAIASINLKKYIKSFVLVQFTFIIIAAINGTQFTPNVIELLNKESATGLPRGREIASQGPALEVGGSESGEIRKIVWGGAINIWKKYPILGTGVETFAFSYYNFRPAEHNLVSEWEYLYNKAHNEYLNFLATTGTIGFGSYLTVIFISAVLFIRKTLSKAKTKLLVIAMLSGYLSILTTNFFGFSVIPVAILFYLYPAMAYALAEHRTKDIEQRIIKTSATQRIAMTFVVFAMFYALVLTGQYWYADYIFAKGKLELDSENSAQARELLLTATELSPKEAIFWDELSQSTTKIAQLLQEKGDEELTAKFINLAINESEKAIVLSSANVNLRRNRASMFIKLSNINPNYLISARETLLDAVKLAPTDAKLFYNLALAYIRTGDNQKAIETLEQTIAMKNNYRNAWLALALLHIDEGEIEKARAELQYILANIGADDPSTQKELDELNSLYPIVE